MYEYSGVLFFHFFDNPPFPPWGGIPSTKFPISKYRPIALKFGIYALKYVTQLMPYSVFRNSLPSPPQGWGLPPKNSKISKFSPIVLKLCIYGLWNITRGRVLSIFRNSLPFHPLPLAPACCLLHCPVSRRGLRLNI